MGKKYLNNNFGCVSCYPWGVERYTNFFTVDVYRDVNNISLRRGRAGPNAGFHCTPCRRSLMGEEDPARPPCPPSVYVVLQQIRTEGERAPCSGGHGPWWGASSAAGSGAAEPSLRVPARTHGEGRSSERGGGKSPFPGLGSVSLGVYEGVTTGRGAPKGRLRQWLRGVE